MLKYYNIKMQRRIEKSRMNEWMSKCTQLDRQQMNWKRCSVCVYLPCVCMWAAGREYISNRLALFVYRRYREKCQSEHTLSLLDSDTQHTSSKCNAEKRANGISASSDRNSSNIISPGHNNAPHTKTNQFIAFLLIFIIVRTIAQCHYRLHAVTCPFVV